jgi:hypothetical protein
MKNQNEKVAGNFMKLLQISYLVHVFNTLLFVVVVVN